MKDFLVKMISAKSGVSSKRVCGCIGFLVVLCIIIYCTISKSEAPEITETLLYCIVTLLGVDSVTSAFKKTE